MVDSGRVIEQAEAMLRRFSPEGRRQAKRARQRRFEAMLRRFFRAAIAALLIALGAGVFGLVVAPIGMTGLLLTALAVAIVAAVILFWPAPAPTPEKLATADLTLLPQRTEEWLERQRPALPAPAVRLVDGIGVKLEALAPQLAGLDPREPAAVEIRKLIAEELPELVSGYQRVPSSLRREVRDGISADKQLVDGLSVVDSELARMTQQLAAGDLQKLATQGRYLELKYKGDSELG